MRAVATFSALSFATSALAIAVTFPQKGDSWSAAGPNTLKWTSVSTDPSQFDVYLVTPDQTFTKLNTAGPVSTSQGTVTLACPAGGCPLGDNYQVDIMNVQTSTTGQSQGILAQSGQFNITSTSVNGSGTTVISGVAPTTMSGMKTTTSASPAATTTGTATLSSSESNLNPTGSPSSATGFFQVSSGLMALAATVHFFF